jgi:hypothetical protein
LTLREGKARVPYYFMLPNGWFYAIFILMAIFQKTASKKDDLIDRGEKEEEWIICR